MILPPPAAEAAAAATECTRVTCHNNRRVRSTGDIATGITHCLRRAACDAAAAANKLSWKAAFDLTPHLRQCIDSASVSTSTQRECH